MYEIEQIIGDIEPVFIKEVTKNFFSRVFDATVISQPYRQVNISIGIHFADMHPVVADLKLNRVCGLCLLTS